ncbi:hypothetical protein AB0M23_21525 [Streptomyces sp. NPDC052077]|uniref:hypothetical protein n=1 Tax=Streptomyces sp. NPDC052077 TaxID=3154757 RepID=UPI0034161CF4
MRTGRLARLPLPAGRRPTPRRHLVPAQDLPTADLALDAILRAHRTRAASAWLCSGARSSAAHTGNGRPRAASSSAFASAVSACFQSSNCRTMLRTKTSTAPAESCPSWRASWATSPRTSSARSSTPPPTAATSR